MAQSTSSRFTSRRERALWGFAAAVTVVIYSTIGLARSLASTLRDRDLLDGAFAFAFLLCLVALAVLAFTSRPNQAQIGVFIGSAAVLLMAASRLGIPEERTHLFEYAILSAFLYEALSERRSNGRGVRFSGVLAVGIAVAIGWLDEGIQAIVPSRVYDLQDVGFNALAAVLGVASLATMRALRRRSSPS